MISNQCVILPEKSANYELYFLSFRIIELLNEVEVDKFHTEDLLKL